MKNICIIGAGPAGVTAAYELAKSGIGNVIVFEKSQQIGGISRTVNYKGNLMDMGGHRFFSKDPKVNAWWSDILPVQGFMSFDDLLLSRDAELSVGGPDPEKEDLVMLIRKRISRILFDNKFYDYPISLKFSTFRNMGLATSLSFGFSYLHSLFFKREEKSLEDFYINRFGKKLYSMFFENYTQNLWGRHPSEISPEWGAQRVKGVSLFAVLIDAIKSSLHIKTKEKETSLIESFYYPKYGPGQFWTVALDKAIIQGAKVYTNCEVVSVHKSEGRIDYIEYIKDGKREKADCDILISSAALSDLSRCMNDVPEEIKSIAENLPYRNFMTLGILVKGLNLTNKTKIATLNDIVPDNWVYVHNKNVRMGRFQIFNNWSPYMVKEPENTVWLGLEYFTSDDGDLWQMSDEQFISLAIDDMLKLSIISDKSQVIDLHPERVEKAYPAYFDSYSEIDKLREYLDTIENLYCIGRNGQHRYNNMDHSMLTAFETVNNILNNVRDKSNIWNVNSEQDYHESKN